MKLRNVLYTLAVVVLITSQLNAQNTNPIVSNVAFSISGTTVTVTYDVDDAEQSTVTISMKVSSDNGITWDFNYGTETGDIGTGISTGINKTVEWEYTGGYNANFKIRIYANDETAGGTTCPGVATVDYGGKTYNTIQIGTQCWLKEDLDVGTRINGSQSASNDGNVEKYCYNDLTSNCDTYGGLYQWDEAMQYVTTEGARGICPEGWHIPTYTEWQTLNTAVSGNGNALKAVGQGTGGGAGTNTSGFSTFLAGFHTGSTFGSLGNYVYFWTSTEYNTESARSLYLGRYDSGIYFYSNFKEYGFSVRCIKN